MNSFRRERNQTSPFFPIQTLFHLLPPPHHTLSSLSFPLPIPNSPAVSSTMGQEPKPNGNVKLPTIGSSVIPILNKLQDIIAPVSSDLMNLSLPHVAVVGSQSSGKSSVLEALVGRDFLPRGCDISTRRPLVLMLENRSFTPGDDGAEWGEFRHLPGKRFYDFSKIRLEIQAETEREAGSNKGVSNKEISLRVSSPNVLNMTLIDLPGITKVPVGDQPSDIEYRIRLMIMTHIKQENCIILAVSPANSDLATSDALQMAKEADPNGSRTIGVITKLDIMDRGTDARNFLLGRVIPLQLGYVGVVNRSQEDINYNKSIRDALAREEQFFSNHYVYKGLSHQCGIPQLAKKLNQILEQHIRMVLPNLKTELHSRMSAVSKELQTYGEDIKSKTEQGVVLLNILRNYCEGFTAMVDGKSREIHTKELFGGARIQHIFRSIFPKSLEGVNPWENITDNDIRMAIQNATSIRNALFVPEVPFEVLVRNQIALLLDPSLQCLRSVYDQLLKMSYSCKPPELKRFPNLKRNVDKVTEKFLQDGVRPAESLIRNIIEMEMDYINSAHPNFIGGDKAFELARQHLKPSLDNTDVERVPTSENGQKSAATTDCNTTTKQGVHPQSNTGKAPAGSNSSTRAWSRSFMKLTSMVPLVNSYSRRPGETIYGTECSSSTIQLREPASIWRLAEMTEQEAVEVFVTKLLVQSYYDIVRNNIQDLVPKAIMHFLVNHAKRELHNTFIHKLYREGNFEEFFQENDEVAAEREHARELLNVLQQAVKALVEFEADAYARTASTTGILQEC
ncbi:dynamin-related protein 3A-like [Euphorbia lathyris]|uniref:dynamin-related protein 3A-like n=1 Tax=Euphorbia lathyris TaxID=212925 RepID=UPI0033139CC7